MGSEDPIPGAEPGFWRLRHGGRHARPLLVLSVLSLLLGGFLLDSLRGEEILLFGDLLGESGDFAFAAGEVLLLLGDGGFKILVGSCMTASMSEPPEPRFGSWNGVFRPHLQRSWLKALFNVARSTGFLCFPSLTLILVTFLIFINFYIL